MCRGNTEANLCYYQSVICLIRVYFYAILISVRLHFFLTLDVKRESTPLLQL
jgi:hypothetical protein